MYDSHITVKKNMNTNLYEIGRYDGMFVGRNDILYWGMKTEEGKILIKPQYYSRNQKDTAEFLLTGTDKEYKRTGCIASQPNWTVVKNNNNIY